MIKNFIFQDQKITLKHTEKEIKVYASMKCNGKWKENLEIPLLILENDEIVFADQLLAISEEINQFKLDLLAEKKGYYLIRSGIKSNKNIQPWFNIRTSFITRKEIKFHSKGPDVQLLFKTPMLPINEVVKINQPTKHTPPTDEWLSNDLPAGYVWNAQSKIATMIFVDISNMDWMSSNTIERFSFYEVGLQETGKFGFIQRINLKKPIVIPSNTKLSFDYYFCQEYREQTPSKWDAVESLISNSFLFLPSEVPFPLNNVSWENFCNGCIKDLLKQHYCWEDFKYPKYHAYVQDNSEFKRREAFKRDFPVFETMTHLDILPPWLIYLQIANNIDKHQIDHVTRTGLGLKDFIDPETNFLYNNIFLDKNNSLTIVKPSENAIGDSWYFFEPIVRFGWFIHLFSAYSDIIAFSAAFRVMCDKSIEFVLNHNYEITAFYDPYSLTPLKESLEKNPERKQLLIDQRGEKDIKWKIIAKNYACLGIFCYLMIQGYYFFSNQEYLSYAIKGAKKFMKFSPDELFWEPLEIAYGIAGFTELGNITGEENYFKFANRLLLNELRMFYWYNDNSCFWKNKRNIQGLVQACIGIRYPAMKENVESIYPWLILLKTGQFSKDILKIFNLVRINSYYYFSNVLKLIGLKESIYPPRVDSPCEYIPFEDIELLETPIHFSRTQTPSPKGKRTGTLGREIYGAGEVIWLYLMFEAFAKTNNERILILNLDLFDFKIMNSLSLDELNFIVYNPLVNLETFNITFLNLKSKMHFLTIFSSDSIILNKNPYSNDQLKNGIQITLEPGEFQYIKLES